MTSFYERLAARSQRREFQPEATGYFGEAADHLDPSLFHGDALRSSVRSAVLSTIHNYLGQKHRGVDSWLTVWIAGSGASYQWEASGDPGDLDVLLGVDWVSFRRSNQDFAGLGDSEIAKVINQDLITNLWPVTDAWVFGQRHYQTTWYINPQSQRDITPLRPYAAYNVTTDAWDVRPNPHPVHDVDAGWAVVTSNDRAHAEELLAKYNKAYDEVEVTSNPGARLNAQITLRAAAREGAALFDDIHEGRKKAFGPQGLGYEDLGEYRYKTAKASGIVSALRSLKQDLKDAGIEDDEATYGVAIPDAQRTLVEAALQRRYRG